jgi:N utilization substance protein B
MGALPKNGPGKSTGHRRRRTARRMAVDTLYQADVREQDPRQVLEEWRLAGRRIPAYAQEVVDGVRRRLAEIDRLLGEHSEEWTVARMAVVDRTILRVACYELLAGLPTAVVINEAVEAANELSTDASGGFINGVLGRIARDLEPEES